MNINKVIRVLVSLGWRVEPTKGGHVKCLPPGGGPIIVMSGSPSDHRAFRNLVSRLVRSGKVKKSDFS